MVRLAAHNGAIAGSIRPQGQRIVGSRSAVERWPCGPDIASGGLAIFQMQRGRVSRRPLRLVQIQPFLGNSPQGNEIGKGRKAIGAGDPDGASGAPEARDVRVASFHAKATGSTRRGHGFPTKCETNGLSEFCSESWLRTRGKLRDQRLAPNAMQHGRTCIISRVLSHERR